MKKEEFSGIVITLDIFRCSVIVFVGKDYNTILKGIPMYAAENSWTSKVKKDTINTLKETFEEEDKRGNLSMGITISDGVDSIVVFFDKNIGEVSMENALHELGHATRQICRAHGIDDEETEMYMHEYLFHSFLCAQDEYNDNKVKTKKKK